MFKIVILLIPVLFAWGDSPAKEQKLYKMGEKVANTLCNKTLLLQIEQNITQKAFSKKINNGICHNIDEDYQKALLIYIKNNENNNTISKIEGFTKESKCPACGMYIYKYPKWVAMMIINGKKVFFDGPKDMMKYYLYKNKFHFDRNAISNMVVLDFYTLKEISAKDAFYVIGSNIRGPMGNELVPFKTLENAQTCLHDHKGEKIIRFHEITTELIAYINRLKRR